jgi:hypothetical protein
MIKLKSNKNLSFDLTGHIYSIAVADLARLLDHKLVNRN